MGRCRPKGKASHGFGIGNDQADGMDVMRWLLFEREDLAKSLEVGK
jgi:hypothetical protein